MLLAEMLLPEAINSGLLAIALAIVYCGVIWMMKE
jgi:hypothetical protein